MLHELDRGSIAPQTTPEDPGIGAVRRRPRARLCAHGRAAFVTALEDGLMADEVAGILAGRRIVEAFPIRRGESPPHYAARAVAEMMAAYLR